MNEMKRTATCGGLNAGRIGEKVTLNGWVHRHRDHGGIIFINLRDRYGVTQVVVDADAPAELRATAAELKMEYVIALRGTVRPRPKEMVNPNMTTGEIEVKAEAIRVLSQSRPLPFMIDEHSEAREDLRLQYRYLDLRSFAMQRNLKLRNDFLFAVREYLVGRDFYEIETPTLIRSTPEGARDYLVPARLQPGKFYALPQSPQIYKQILMVGGFDRYFQIARCYRDEDPRGDRQPEFTQVDIEMSFVSREDVFAVVEGMMQHAFRKAAGKEIAIPFPRVPYHDAMNRYGSDKPDLRYGLEMQDFGALAAESQFEVFRAVAQSGGTIKALVVPGAGEYSRKQITALEDIAKIYKAKGLAWMKVTSAGLEGGVARFFGELAPRVVSTLKARPGDLLLFVADGNWKTACTALGAVRGQLGKDLKLFDPSVFHFSWIVDFPLFEWNEDEKKWDPAHHMFTMPQAQYLDTMEKDPGAVKGDLYDLVLNGVEAASGSIRIHDPALQQRVFNIVGINEEEAKKRFGFMLEAFHYGAPPHGGIAPGVDRLIMLIAGESTIREVIAFPKNTLGISPMDDAPNTVDQKQMDELHIRLVPPEEKK